MKSRTIKRLDRQIAKLNQKLEKQRDKENLLLQDSIDRVILSMKVAPYFEGNNYVIRENHVARVDQTTGEVTDFLFKFDYDTIRAINYYLEAYLTTNREVLDDDQIRDLEGLIEKLR